MMLMSRVVVMTVPWFSAPSPHRRSSVDKGHIKSFTQSAWCFRQYIRPVGRPSKSLCVTQSVSYHHASYCIVRSEKRICNVV